MNDRAHDLRVTTPFGRFAKKGSETDLITLDRESPPFFEPFKNFKRRNQELYGIGWTRVYESFDPANEFVTRREAIAVKDTACLRPR